MASLPSTRVKNTRDRVLCLRHSPRVPSSFTSSQWASPSPLVSLSNGTTPFRNAFFFVSVTRVNTRPTTKQRPYGSEGSVAQHAAQPTPTLKLRFNAACAPCAPSHEDVTLFFESEQTMPEVGHESYDVGHGRTEVRTVRASSKIDWLKERNPHWIGLKSIVAVTAKRECNNKCSEETRYFISSLDATNPQYLGHVVRSHWGIENNLHWVLDYAFQEDDQRTRMGNSAANMSIIRHIALNLLKSDKTAKVGVKNKRLKAGWDNNYLMSVLLSLNKKRP